MRAGCVWARGLGGWRQSGFRWLARVGREGGRLAATPATVVRPGRVRMGWWGGVVGVRVVVELSREKSCVGGIC